MPMNCVWITAVHAPREPFSDVGIISLLSHSRSVDQDGEMWAIRAMEKNGRRTRQNAE
jgi:hypothetical protein